MTAQPTLSTDAPAADEPAAEPPVHKRRRLPMHAAAAAFFLGLALLVMGNYLPAPDERISDHLANDNAWFQWLLSHAVHSVTHLENPLFSVRQNFPDGVNMMANTSVLGVTLPMVPVTMLTGPRIAYVIWMVLALAGSAFAAYYVLQRWVVRSRVAALLGGAFFGFAPGFVHHANGQPNFASNFVLPFLAVAVFRLGIGGRWLRDGVILGLLVTYQVFINEEMLVVAAAALVVAVLAYAVLRPRFARQRVPAFLAGTAVTAVVAGSLLAYPLWFPFQGPQTFEALPLYHSWGEDLGTYLYFSRDTIVGDPIVEKTMGYPEQNSWFGWPLTLVVVASILLMVWRSLAVRVAAVVGVVFAVLAMGPRIRWMGEYSEVPGPWHWIPDDLPVLGLLMPSRLTFAVVGVFALITALAYDAASRIRSRRHWWTRGASVLAAAAIVAALVPLTPRPLPVRAEPLPPAFLTSGAWKPYVPEGRSLIPLPLPNRWSGVETLGWSAYGMHEFVVPEGYFLGPGADGHGLSGAPWSRLTRLVDGTLKSGKVPKVTDHQRLEVQRAIEYYRGSLLVLRDIPAHENVRLLMEQLLGPGTQTMDVWIWTV